MPKSLVDKDLLLSQLRESESPSYQAVAQLFTSDSPFVQLIGMVLRETEERGRGLMNQDLVSEEGRMRALQVQGEVRGAMGLIERILDMVIEGKEEDKVQ